MWRIEITKRLKINKYNESEEIWHIKMNGEDDDDILMDIDCPRNEAGTLLSTLADRLVEPNTFKGVSSEQMHELQTYGICKL